MLRKPKMFTPVFSNDGRVDLELTFPVEQVARDIGMRLKSPDISKYQCTGCPNKYVYHAKFLDHKAAKGH
jgi:hypothetical protein